MNFRQYAIGVLVILLLPVVTGFSASALRGRASSTLPAALGERPDGARLYPGKFAELAPQATGWQQVNEDGFGDPQAGAVSALAVFNSYLYAATSNPLDGARIFRSLDGVAWSPVTDPGFGITHDIRPPAILGLTAFKGRVYASTGRGDGPGQIWRAVDGVNWAPMVIHGFSNPDTVDINALTEYDNFFYAGATNLVTGAQIWRSLSGDNNTWSQVAPAGLQTPVSNVSGMAVFDGALYAALDSEWVAQVWRSNGGAWTTVVSNGFGDPNTKSTGGMAVFAGYLYVGAGNTVVGAHLWRTSDGASWDQVIDPGFGDPYNKKVEMVFVYQNLLYAGVTNAQTGMELWRSADGVTWEQANLDGFGDPDNAGSNGSQAVVEFLGDLYLGTSNLADGGELWRLPGQLPPPTPTSPPQLTARQFLPCILGQP